MLGDHPTNAAVIDPELAHAAICTREGEARGGLRMGEVSGIEIQTDLPGFRPCEPAVEMRWREFIAIDGGGAGLGVERVQVQALHAGEKPQHLIKIGAHFVAIAGASRITAGRHDAARIQPAFWRLKPADIVRLPAVKRNRNIRARG